MYTDHQTIKQKNAVLLKANNFNQQSFHEGPKRRIQGSFQLFSLHANLASFIISLISFYPFLYLQ